MSSPKLERLFSDHCGFRRSLTVIIAVTLALTAIAVFGCGNSANSTQPPPTAHSVNLTWNTSPSTGVAYNVYRGDVSNGPYVKLNSTPVAGTTYTDTGVQSTHTYYYVVTAVDDNGLESVYSNQTSATIP